MFRLVPWWDAGHITAMNRDEVIQRLRQRQEEFRRRYHVRRLAVFGSYAHDVQRPDSDLDLLVEFEETPGLFDFVRLKDALTQLLGVKVDLVMEDALRPRLRQQVLRDAIAI
jgi:predicted nucleotidyltransferase